MKHRGAHTHQAQPTEHTVARSEKVDFWETHRHKEQTQTECRVGAQSG
jgi:hypothetical protein